MRPFKHSNDAQRFGEQPILIDNWPPVSLNCAVIGFYPVITATKA